MPRRVLFLDANRGSQRIVVGGVRVRSENGAKTMARSRRLTCVLLTLSSSLLLGTTCSGDFFFSITFIKPDKAESTETQTAELSAGTPVRITNDIGSTRVTVDPNATEATIQILRTALANSTAEAEELLDAMTVTMTPAVGDEDPLVIHAVRPPDATGDSAHFQATITEDEINVVAILGSVSVATYRLRITLPPGHEVELVQEVGEVRVVGLDAPSAVTARAGSVRSVAGEAELNVAVSAGSARVLSHRGSLSLDLEAGSAYVDLVSLAAADSVNVRTEAGDIDILLPADVSALLRARADAGRVRFRVADFHSATSVTASRTRVAATLGAGGPPIDLRALAGNIDIRSF